MSSPTENAKTLATQSTHKQTFRSSQTCTLIINPDDLCGCDYSAGAGGRVSVVLPATLAGVVEVGGGAIA